MRQVQADRDKYRDMIHDLSLQAASFAPLTAAQVCAFVAEVDRRLALLSDERMVLKAFDKWPEQRMEAMREVAARSKELSVLLASLDPSQWEPKSSISDEIQRTEDVFSKAQATVDWYSRCREELSRKYSAHRLPFDFGGITRVQQATVGLAKHAMSLALTANQRLQSSQERGEVVAKATVDKVVSVGDSALRLAFRCHQGAGGFDSEATGMFSALQASVIQQMEAEQRHMAQQRMESAESADQSSFESD